MIFFLFSICGLFLFFVKINKKIKHRQIAIKIMNIIDNNYEKILKATYLHQRVPENNNDPIILMQKEKNKNFNVFYSYLNYLFIGQQIVGFLLTLGSYCPELRIYLNENKKDIMTYLDPSDETFCEFIKRR